MSSEEEIPIPPPLPDLDIGLLRVLMGNVLAFSAPDANEVELKQRILDLLNAFGMPASNGNEQILEQLKKMNADMKAMRADMKAMKVDTKAVKADIKGIRADMKTMQATQVDLIVPTET
jgi:septal ring factor EnvC (AmiA/AmiB activator)